MNRRLKIFLSYLKKYCIWYGFDSQYNLNSRKFSVLSSYLLEVVKRNNCLEKYNEIIQIDWSLITDDVPVEEWTTSFYTRYTIISGVFHYIIDGLLQALKYRTKIINV